MQFFRFNTVANVHSHQVVIQDLNNLQTIGYCIVYYDKYNDYTGRIHYEKPRTVG